MRTLLLTCWNVNGLYRRAQNYCKLKDREFLDSVSNFDIIGLVETHAGSEDNISLPNYDTYQYNRPKIAKAYKHTGGIAALVRDDISRGVNLVSSGEFSIWLKLDKTFFNLEKDIFLCIAYLPTTQNIMTLILLIFLKNKYNCTLQRVTYAFWVT